LSKEDEVCAVVEIAEFKRVNFFSEEISHEFGPHVLSSFLVSSVSFCAD
jgi:hypothetical protein